MKDFRGLLLVLILGSVILSVGYLIQGRKAPSKQSEIEALISTVPLPSGSLESKRASFQKWSNGMVRRTFSTTSNATAIVEFYKQEMPMEGWKPASQQGSLAAYCKNGHPLLLRELDKDTEGHFLYSLTINWGLESPC